MCNVVLTSEILKFSWQFYIIMFKQAMRHITMEEDRTFLKTTNPQQRIRYRLKAANCDVASFKRPFRQMFVFLYFFLAILG
jgi:hypothetical protein